jgi:hypothetical protein
MIYGPLHHLLLGLLPWIGLCLLLYATPYSILFVAFGILSAATWLARDTQWLGTLGQGQCPTPPAHQTHLAPDFAQKVVTYFYPGLGGSWMQALRYVGPEGLNGSSLPNAPLLMYSMRPINPPEVVYGGARWPLLSVPWVFMGMITRIGVALHGIKNPMAYFLNVPLTSFAQHGDQYRFLSALRSEASDSRVKNARCLVLAGSSRGASTVLGAVAQMTPEELNRVGLVLLEGAFDTVPAVARARFGPYLGALVTWVLTWATSYDPSSPTPLDLAKSFPAKVPVAFVTSEADTVVPMAHTLALRDAVVAARGGNAAHVHTLILKKSWHSFYANQDLEDQTAYRAFVDSLYRKYI